MKKALTLISKNVNSGLKILEKVIDQNVNPIDVLSFLYIQENDNIATKGMKRQAFIKIKKQLDDNNTNNDEISTELENVIDSYFNNKEKICIDDYETIIFDADNTIWEGECAANLIAPFKVEQDMLTDSQGKQIRLKDGIVEVLNKLREYGKNIGLISKSEKENIDYQNQPIILALKAFGLLDLFNKEIVIDGNLPKSIFMPKEPHVLFIDDNIDNLNDVDEHTNASVFNAKNIKEYENDLFDFDSDIEPLEVLEYEEDEDIDELTKNFLQEDDEVAIPFLDGVLIRAKIKKASRDHIPASEIPKKPNGKGEYELDHMKPKHKGGQDKKDNLQWIPKNEHEKKSKDEGSFEYGGEKRQDLFKNEKSYHKFQSDAAKEKINQEKSKLGEKGFSDLQSERAKKRWNKK
jgi:magnesium-dependent phosphatase-1